MGNERYAGVNGIVRGGGEDIWCVDDDKLARGYCKAVSYLEIT